MEGNRITDKLMFRIMKYLLPGTDPYNRVYEIVEKYLYEDIGLTKTQLRLLSQKEGSE